MTLTPKERNQVIKALSLIRSDKKHFWEEEVLKMRTGYHWSIAQITRDYLLLLDSYYGSIALFKLYPLSLEDIGEARVISSDQKVIGLSESYGLKKVTLFSKEEDYS